MQEQVNDKTVTLVVKGTKLTGRLLAQAVKKLLDERNKRNGQSPASYKGKQTVKQLVGQGAGVTNIEITDANIKSFEPFARKYGIDYALKKDSTETPPKWLIFFKSKDADALTAAFKEFTAKTVNRDGQEKPSILDGLKKMKELAASLVTDKVKHKDKGIEL